MSGRGKRRKGCYVPVDEGALSLEGIGDLDEIGF